MWSPVWHLQTGGAIRAVMSSSTAALCSELWGRLEITSEWDAHFSARLTEPDDRRTAKVM